MCPPWRGHHDRSVRALGYTLSNAACIVITFVFTVLFLALAISGFGNPEQSSNMPMAHRLKGRWSWATESHAGIAQAVHS